MQLSEAPIGWKFKIEHHRQTDRQAGKGNPDLEKFAKQSPHSRYDHKRGEEPTSYLLTQQEYAAF